MHRTLARVLGLLLGLSQLSAVATASAASAADYGLPSGHFYSQANGMSGVGGTGYAIVDANQSFPGVGVTSIPFYTAFQGFGGVAAVGYPASQVTVFPDFPIQVCQKLVLQEQPGKGTFVLNTFDLLHDRGFDAYLDSARAIPPQADNSADNGLTFDQVVARHQGFLSNDPAIQSMYFGVPNPLLQFGLPTAVKDYGNVYVVRAQRAAFQHWRANVGPNKAGSVTIVNGGDIGKEVSLFPSTSVVPVGPPAFSTNIIVLTPGAGTSSTTPLAVGGYARLFEAAGNYELRNGSGPVIASGTFQAVSGTSNDLARFDFSVPFSVPSPQNGSLTVFSLSAKDGSRINVVTVPLTLGT